MKLIYVKINHFPKLNHRRRGRLDTTFLTRVRSVNRSHPKAIACPLQGASGSAINRCLQPAAANLQLTSRNAPSPGTASTTT